MDRFRFFRVLASGQKYQNGIANGNFASGLTSWLFSNAGTPAVVDGTLQFTPTAEPTNASLTQHAYQMYPSQGGNRYYACAYVKSAVTLRLQLHVGGFGQVPQINTWQWISGVYLSGVTGSRAFGLRDIATSEWGQTECTHIAIINLTERFGSGNEPTAIWCDQNIRPNIVW